VQAKSLAGHFPFRGRPLASSGLAEPPARRRASGDGPSCAGAARPALAGSPRHGPRGPAPGPRAGVWVKVAAEGRHGCGSTPGNAKARPTFSGKASGRQSRAVSPGGQHVLDPWGRPRARFHGLTAISPGFRSLGRPAHRDRRTCALLRAGCRQATLWKVRRNRVWQGGCRASAAARRMLAQQGRAARRRSGGTPRAKPVLANGIQ
jgi:hypothetical protein